MTVEELKKEANKLGYKIIKKDPYVLLSKCPICGHKPERWHGKDFGYFYRCVSDIHVSITSEPSLTYNQAKKNWNKLVEELWLEKSNSNRWNNDAGI